MTMIVEFNDGTKKRCRPPVEQKLFKDGRPNGWLLSIRISEQINSTELDALLCGGVETLILKDDTGIELFTLTGYEKAISCSVRYAENADDFIAEIQLSKGV